MTTGQKIYECRRKAGMTQEELADRLNVSRQAVSKWESDAAFPETEKILELCKLFSLSADELLFGERTATQEKSNVETRAEFTEEPQGAFSNADKRAGEGTEWGVIRHENKWHYEYKSKAKLFGIPVLHINCGLGVYCARGIFAIGNIAFGIGSLGLLSLGILSLGVLVLGLFAFGSVALGLSAFGGVAVGITAFGGVAIGVFSLGGLAIGYFAAGGAAIGQFVVGDWAHGYLAVGVSHASGTHAFTVPAMLNELSAWLDENAPPAVALLVRAFANIVGG